MPDEEPLHEGAQSEEVLGIGDHVSAQPLVVAELPDGQRPIEAVELLVAEEDRVHGRGREDLADLGEDAARQLTPEELDPRRVTDEPAVVVDDGQSDVERLPVEVHRERHAPGRDGDPEARRGGALERRDERGLERQGMIDERAVEIADEELVAHAP